ncbi:hypothetical protein A3F57_05780 [Candidatus Roizmanbacteria bacterium RIFCSPHIGHO2_12_FULL_36_11]|nr:MAG: hypothetical protein A3F57_05780 [Candidatus Roizmanbacteria bacterium RIFCSPHIGHO2_12_FULL_36_11]
MKKFLLIVNTSVLLFLFSYAFLPSKTAAQTPTISQTTSQANPSRSSIWVELLKILFGLGAGQQPGYPTPPPGTPYPTISGSPTYPISPYITPPPQPGGYVYYHQCSGIYGNPWGDYPLPSGCTICEAGCGPTTVAMIVASLVDKSIDPKKVVDHYKNAKPFPYYLGCAGSRYSDAKATLEFYGLDTTPYFTYSLGNYNELARDFKGYLGSGWTIFALANFCDGGCGHFFWITDISSTWAYDPYYGRREAPPIDENRYNPFPQYRVAFGVRKK